MLPGSTIRHYTLAVVGSALVLLVGLAVSSIDPDDSIPALLFLVIVGLSAWYGGLGPALIATIAGAAAIDYFFEVPRYELEITRLRTVADIVAFFLLAGFVGLIHYRLRLINRHLEEERDRAEAAVLARDDLIATVSHALRTPLTTIQMSLFSLSDDVRQLGPSERQRLVTVIISEANRLVRFVNDVLALNRLENRPPVRSELNDVGEVVWASVDHCLAALESRPITLEIPEDLPLVDIDAGLLDQALTALLENIVVHTPPGSPVWIEGGIKGDDLLLAVSDAGPGIPATDRQRVFLKYERLEGRGPGVGLGLAVARTAIELQGGRLWAEGSEHGGTRMVLTLPRTGAKREAA
jgi:two-component system sensor histidine kinase KdpD